MSCHEWDERLNDLVDGLLPADGRRAVEAHVAGCEGCRGALEATRALRERAAALPGEEPPRDLWPAILAALPGPVAALPGRGAAPSRRRPPAWVLGLAAAAILVIGFAAGLLLRPARMESAGGGPALASFRQARIDYEAAASDLLGLLEERRGELAPETLAVVEENLRIIDAAIRDVWEAVEKDPGHAGYGHRFTDLYGRKIALLRRAVLLPGEG
jgi:hypothetical protein